MQLSEPNLEHSLLHNAIAHSMHKQQSIISFPIRTTTNKHLLLHPMHLTDWSHLFIEQIHQTSPLEWTAMIFAVLSVLLARYNKVGLYPTGIISTAIYIYIFLQPSIKLYADALLNVYYLAMSIFGWIVWTRKRGEGIYISVASRRDWSIALAIALAGWAFLYCFLVKFTDSQVPIWDAFISATAWSGMWLLAKHKLENWLMLNVSNLAAIPLYFYKQLPVTALLTIFLFIVAIIGYLEWKKIIRASQQSLAA